VGVSGTCVSADLVLSRSEPMGSGTLTVWASTKLRSRTPKVIVTYLFSPGIGLISGY